MSDFTLTFGDPLEVSVAVPEGATQISVSIPELNPVVVNNALAVTGGSGAPGEGVEPGGTENQFLQKNSATDYDTKWSAYTLPAADGDDGQVLTTDGAGTVSFAHPKTISENVKNVSGGTLLKGTPVHVTGSSGNLAEVIAADAATNYPAHFVLDQDLNDDGEGLGIALGFINNVDVPDASIYSEGQTVYLGASGGWTTTKPTGTNAIQDLGIIIKVNTSGNKISGIIMGAGRSNDVPNIATGNVWAGNASGVATATDKLYVDIANSRIGIGTTSPATPLHVNLTSSQDTNPPPWISNGIAVSSPSTYGIRRIGFEGPNRTTGAYIESSAESGSGGQKSYLAFTTRAASISEKMRIDSAGRVGIGTTSPNEQLHVDGNIEISNGKIVSSSNGDIDIEPNGTGNVLLGNFKFDADQTVGVGQDNHVLTYDHAARTIGLEASAGGGGANMENTFSAPSSVGAFQDGARLAVDLYGTAPSATAGTLVNFGNTAPSAVGAQSVSTAATGMLTVVTDAANGDELLIEGVVKMSSNTGWSASKKGTPLYMSTTPGAVTTTAPSTAGEFVRVVGHVVDGANSTMYFKPDNTWLEL